MNLKNKTIAELYPELGDRTNSRRYIEFLNEDVQIFVNKCYEHAGYEINDYVNTVCEIMMDYLVRKGHINPETHRHSLVDCLLIAALLHDIYFEGHDKPSTLFKAREELAPIARQGDLYIYGPIPEQVIDAVFQAIEEQVGDASVIQKLTPVPGSPSDLLATSIWIASNLCRWLYQ
jgi:hypothetical protein